MQIFNVGVLELLFILIIAFIVLGPKRTIKSAGDVGAWIRNFIKSPFWREIMTTSNEIRDLPKKFMNDAELQKMIEDLDLSTQEIKDMISQTQTETESELHDLQEQINQEMPTNPPPIEEFFDET